MGNKFSGVYFMNAWRPKHVLCKPEVKNLHESFFPAFSFNLFGPRETGHSACRRQLGDETCLMWHY